MKVIAMSQLSHVQQVERLRSLTMKMISRRCDIFFKKRAEEMSAEELVKAMVKLQEQNASVHPVMFLFGGRVNYFLNYLNLDSDEEVGELEYLFDGKSISPLTSAVLHLIFTRAIIDWQDSYCANIFNCITEKISFATKEQLLSILDRYKKNPPVDFDQENVRVFLPALKTENGLFQSEILMAKNASHRGKFILAIKNCSKIARYSVVFDSFNDAIEELKIQLPIEAKM